MEDKNLVVLKDLKLVTKEDVAFLQKNSKEFLDRYRRRSLFRSKFEMDALVLNDTEHPTPDSKYWQAIGEQAVHVSELVRLGFNAKKSDADIKLMESQIEELEDKKQQVVANKKPGYKSKNIDARIEKKQVEIEEKQYGLLECKKVAQERIKEIRNWEDIIPNLEANLKHGKEDWEKHHPERALLRTEWQMKNFDLLDIESKKNTVKFFISSVNHPDNKELVEERKGELQEVSDNYKPQGQLQEGATSDDPAMQKLLDRKRKTLMVIHAENSKVDFGNLRPPPTMAVVTRTMPTVVIPEAVKYGIDNGADMVYIVEDDIVPPVDGMMKLMAKNELGVTGTVYRDDKIKSATLLVNIEAIRAVDAMGGKNQELEPVMHSGVECLYLDGGVLKGNPKIVNENGRPIGEENFEKFNGTYLHRIGVPESQDIPNTEATLDAKPPGG